MSAFSYFSGGKRISIQTESPGAARMPAGTAARRVKTAAVRKLTKAMKSAVMSENAQPLFVDAATADLQRVKAPGATDVVLTETIIVEGARTVDLHYLRDKHGFEVIREGLEGKVLLKAPSGGAEGIAEAFKVANLCYARRNIKAAHPNFIRVLHVPKVPAGAIRLWNHDNDGKPGVTGADIALTAAWTLTRGSANIRVAVLDEGVDSLHPALKAAMVAEKDFAGSNVHARPDNDDAHGTACAGIIASRDTKVPGIAPEVGLIGVRIAMGDGNNGWIFDDFQTGDAIDWSWKKAKADVLSNSWGGGPPVDVITRAIERARTKGRAGKGAVVVCAAGNEDGPVCFPGTMETVLTVGASNQWDERKSPASRDGESNWGSNYGPALDVMAPGVAIATTDISGARGYANGHFTGTFNGTSSATPHVAAVAALILSLRPDLKEAQVREAITVSADVINSTGAWDKFTGHGRLNAFAALRLARRL